jgi:hypothetical protein
VKKVKEEKTWMEKARRQNTRNTGWKNVGTG